MKKIIFFVLFLFMISCSQKIECNKPYILVGAECCLDQNDNSICDEDETVEESLTIDISTDLINILDEDIILVEDKKFGQTKFYTYSSDLFFPTSVCVSGCPGVVRNEKINIDKISFLEITGDGIDQDGFYDYFSSIKDFLIEELNEDNIEFESKFNTSEWLNRYNFRDEHKKNFSDYVFTNLKIERNLLFNQITQMSDGNVFEFIYTNINNYTTQYNDSLKDKWLRRVEEKLDFMHLIGIYCNKNLVVLLYGNPYNPKDVTMSGRINKEAILSQFRENNKNLYPKMVDVLDVCDDFNNLYKH